MSETDLVSTEATPTAATGAPARKRGGLTGMVLAELRQLAGELNIPGIAGMRKGDLIAAIKSAQGGAPTPGNGAPEAGATSGPVAKGARAKGDAKAPARAATSGDDAGSPAETPAEPTAAAPVRERRRAVRAAGAPAANGVPTTNGASAVPEEAHVAPAAPAETPVAAAPAQPAETPATPATPDRPAEAADAAEGGGRRRQMRGRNRAEREQQPAAAAAASTEATPAAGAPPAGTDTPEPDGDGDRGPREGRRNRNRNDRGERGGTGPGGDRPDNREDTRGGRNDRASDRTSDRNDRNDRNNDGPDDSDDDGEGRGRRGRRFRDRRRGRDRDRTSGQGREGVDTEVREGDVLLPVAGIVDILDNYAFVRTTGYLSGPTDVYVSLSMVRKYGLRRGDAITGAVREPREGEQSRQKFNPLVRVDTINGQDPELSKQRPEFTKLTPLYPNERLRLETEPHKLTTRVIDLVMPVGKGQRALIVSPPKAGKTTIMQNIANAITTNNPECHLMVVLVDERPEEVTDMQRSVKGEVIASTFDRPPTDHTTVAELSIERAKRLVELGHDVVVLLDNITRLGRAYNLAAPASGRILSGGVDSTALYPPKRFLGAARNIEDGGSLTIFATALVETGSTMDTVIFEEFKGTGNAELRLDRRIADKRVFPAIDVGDSGTRKEELIMSPDEYAVMVKLRRVLAALDDQQAIDLLLTQLKKTRTNIEFLMQVAKGMPVGDD
ncbi:transcription termination factor Rho [Pseudonocardia sp.]|uniref:transcription termination factor Rho n=1 Tax=Pseudonocardia sp. TaxID=60912 RepID=UPI003D145CE1